MHEDIRRIGLWVDESVAAKSSFGATNRLIAPGLLCVGVSAKRHGDRIHMKVYVSRRQRWDILAMDESGSVVAIAAREYAPQGIMPARFYQRLHKPWRRKLATS